MKLTRSTVMFLILLVFHRCAGDLSDCVGTTTKCLNRAVKIKVEKESEERMPCIIIEAVAECFEIGSKHMDNCPEHIRKNMRSELKKKIKFWGRQCSDLELDL
ncbi:Uncharacterised protein g10511 [Pycnogonum litorale]